MEIYRDMAYGTHSTISWYLAQYPQYPLQVLVDVGRFESEEDAALAYDRAAVWCLGLTTPTNFPVAERIQVAIACQLFLREENSTGNCLSLKSFSLDRTLCCQCLHCSKGMATGLFCMQPGPIRGSVVSEEAVEEGAGTLSDDSGFDGEDATARPQVSLQTAAVLQLPSSDSAQGPSSTSLLPGGMTTLHQNLSEWIPGTVLYATSHCCWKFGRRCCADTLRYGVPQFVDVSETARQPTLDVAQTRIESLQQPQVSIQAAVAGQHDHDNGHPTPAQDSRHNVQQQSSRSVQSSTVSPAIYNLARLSTASI
jgi:hypothetical protein